MRIKKYTRVTGDNGRETAVGTAVLLATTGDGEKIVVIEDEKTGDSFVFSKSDVRPAGIPGRAIPAATTSFRGT